tara:strand:- start:691 stop:1695 length:1005 start_codon:yes stop_codon:yes gene_type:complete
MSKKIIFSGVQPTGNLHLGNYIGAIKNFVNLQNEKDNKCIYCVVDLHAITVKQDPKILKNNIRQTAAVFLASGIDPKKSIIFNQSLVSAHTEASWFLNCVVRIGWLNRMTQFKEKAGKNKEKASVGLYVYPTLMAADILLYDTTHVPVGEDQKQHLELARDIAQKFNLDFKVEDFFVIPEPLIQKDHSRIMSLKSSDAKMSKSDPSDASRINLSDSNELIVNKIQKAKTDDQSFPENEKNLKERPEINNLVNIYSSLLEQDNLKTLNEFNGKNFAAFKKKLSEVVIEKISPISREIAKIKKDPSFIDKVLLDGGQNADKLASKKIKKIKEIIGF